MELWSTLFIIAWCVVDLVLGARFELYYTTKASWSEANEFCKERNRIFAKVDSSTDQEWVETLAPFMSGFFWIGLKGGNTTGQFVWTDSTPAEYTNWAEGFPGTATGRDCVRMRDFDFKWETFNCSEPLYYLCEDAYFRESYVVSDDTKIKGLIFGFGLIGGLLIFCCLLLQLPCCRSTVSHSIAKIGFGRKKEDENLFM